LERLRRQGREHERHRVTVDLGYVELLAGNWDAAERYLQEAFEISVDRGDHLEEALLAEPLGRLAAYRGEVDEARRLVNFGVSYGELHWTAVSETSQWVLGHLELALGNPKRAWELLAGVNQRIELDWAVFDIPEAIETLTALGRWEQAEELLTRFEERWVDNRWALHAAMRCRS
jgi:tetratricopeptide (TPR) repeat protein